MLHEVIMPALGMAQDSGLIVAWNKAPGDVVNVGDVLMEVETDKAVMEVEAQADGVLIDVRAGVGEDVPVGTVIAMIGSSADEATARPNVESAPAGDGSAKAAVPKLTPSNAAAIPSEKQGRPTEGRILASPKARRLAAERGLALRGLAETGQPQPILAADVERFAVMPVPGVAQTMLSARASVPAPAYLEFIKWLDQECGQGRATVLASFACSGLRAVTGGEEIAVLVSSPGAEQVTYFDPDRVGLQVLKPANTAPPPSLVVQDLSSTGLSEACLGPTAVPRFTVGLDGDRIVACLMAATGSLNADQVVSCLNEFAGRLHEPLRHLL